ncbi:MAG: arginase [Sarcina sp.]
MKINVVGIPLHYGCDRFGVEKGPKKLREKGLINILEKYGNKVYDLGDLVIEELPASEKYKDDKHMKWVGPIIEANENLAEVVYDTVKTGYFAFSIGGDHAMGLGTLAGTSKYFGDDYGIVWIDAHGDINTGDSSPSGNIHGMPLAASMGFGDERLTNLYFKGKKVDSSKVFLLCQRDLDKGEIELIKKYNINFWSSEDIKEKGITAIMEEVTKKMEEIKVNNFHVSFDIDAMDSNLVPGTGTPVSGGITLHDAEYLLCNLFSTGKVRALDFAEYNPGLEYDITTTVCMKLLDSISSCLADAPKN